MNRKLFPALLALASLVFAQNTLRETNPAKQTALDRYVAKPDPAYRWSVAKSMPGQGVTAHLLEMTSQNWLTANEVDRTEWKHWVTVIQPEKVSSDMAFLMIVGGANDGKVPERLDPFLVQVAQRTGTPVVELRMIPNQPLSFFGESRKRTEDAIIAFTWKKYLETGDDRWPARLPMTKAAVRAMDAATEFLASEQGGRVKTARWVVCGGSKRGWTTWTTGIVDRRVAAIVPAVIDLLNMGPSFIHHWRAYGFWAPAVDDYVEHGVMEWMGSKQFDNLLKIVEPYSYRERLTIPKFIVNSAGDQFFLPDSSQFYFDGLKGEKYLRYVPNSDHAVTKKTDAAESIAAFYESMVKDWRRPEFSWTIGKDGLITVNTKDKPKAVKVWVAANAEARDFRLEKIGPAYKSADVAESAPGRYTVTAPKVEKGWAAYFVELTFPTPGGTDWKFTTPVKVMPDVYPYPAPKPRLPAGATPLTN
jgi:PhoPQ-activated pathogenicity-related protein